RGEAGSHRADAGLRPRRASLRGAARGRAGLHREPLDQPRSPHPRAHASLRGLRSRRLLGTGVSESRYITARLTARERVAYDARIIGVLSRSEFKLKYAGSLLGYVWSLAKPLAYFTVLWVVFGSIFKSSIDRFPLYLLIGIVLNTFLIDAVSATLPSI